MDKELESKTKFILFFSYFKAITNNCFGIRQENNGKQKLTTHNLKHATMQLIKVTKETLFRFYSYAAAVLQHMLHTTC